ncbi:MAG TPA: hypothetical protein VGK48_18770 [Terriglobia bacterium]|jgi:hypothetical protein
MSLPRTVLLLSVVITALALGVDPAPGQKLAPILGQVAGARTPCTQDTRISLENIENYNWSYCNLDLHSFWNSLQVPVGRFTGSELLFDVSSTYGDVDGDGIDERLLHLRLEFNQVSRIVVLKPPTAQVNRWRTVAFLDLDTFHLDPEGRVVTSGRERWLAVSHIEKAWGTGIFQENESWYALSNGRFREVLSFPAEGHVTRVGAPVIEVKFKTSVELGRFDGSKNAINVQYTTTVGDFADLPIRTAVRFTKSPSASAFTFDPAGSTISSGDFLAILNIDSGKLTDQRFLNFAYPALRVVAHRDASALEWLSELLNSCDATTQKACASLTSALESRQR